MSQRFSVSIYQLSVWLLATFSCPGCGLLRSDKPGEEIIESLPLPAKLVVDVASAEPPSLRRDWRPELSVMPYSTMTESTVKIHHVRACRWRSATDYDVKHDDWQFAWADVESTDFIVVPFKATPSLAHTMLSFGLRDGRYLALSVEARLEAEEDYSPIVGAVRQYDLMYILGDETDLLGLRGQVRRDDVYIYRSKATPEQSAKILRSVLMRADALAVNPEYYDSFRNSCATNIARHIRQMVPEGLNRDWRLILPGHSDKLAYDLKLIDTSRPFPEVRRQAYASVKIRQYVGDENFSQLIRRH